MRTLRESSYFLASSCKSSLGIPLSLYFFFAYFDCNLANSASLRGSSSIAATPYLVAIDARGFPRPFLFRIAAIKSSELPFDFAFDFVDFAFLATFFFPLCAFDATPDPLDFLASVSFSLSDSSVSVSSGSLLPDIFVAFFFAFFSTWSLVFSSVFVKSSTFFCSIAG